MGVFPTSQCDYCKVNSLPHARGGVSLIVNVITLNPKSSPRPWGCFQKAGSSSGEVKVFPTPVGVFLDELPQAVPAIRLPHARGGVSYLSAKAPLTKTSSPRPWGCFQLRGSQTGTRRVFPTPVGVFPKKNGFPAKKISLPHARGGVSHNMGQYTRFEKSSPRPWGCFQKRQHCHL